MTFHFITLFPDMFRSYLSESILKRAAEDKKIKFKFYNPRDYAKNKHDRVDRKPYGGGPGMVIQAEPVIRAVEKAYADILKNSRTRGAKKLQAKSYKLKARLIWLSPSGKQFDTEYAQKAAKKYSDIIIVCGRYEGIDARVKKVFTVDEVSVGPFVLTGGELPAMIIADCVARQIRGVLGDFASLEENRVSSPDVYTRPEAFVYKKKTYHVPKILLSGHRAKIDEWKKKRVRLPK